MTIRKLFCNHCGRRTRQTSWGQVYNTTRRVNVTVNQCHGCGRLSAERGVQLHLRRRA